MSKEIRDKFYELFASNTEAVEFETQVLSISKEFLPASALAVLDQNNFSEPTEDYWEFLIEQFEKMNLVASAIKDNTLAGGSFPLMTSKTNQQSLTYKEIAILIRGFDFDHALCVGIDGHLIDTLPEDAIPCEGEHYNAEGIIMLDRDSGEYSMLSFDTVANFSKKIAPKDIPLSSLVPGDYFKWNGKIRLVTDLLLGGDFDSIFPLRTTVCLSTGKSVWLPAETLVVRVKEIEAFLKGKSSAQSD